MEYFLYKLIPPRPAFHMDMNEEEKNIMGRHGQYWSVLFEKRKAVIFGPVLDPQGVFGLGILEVGSEAEAREIVAGDPAVSTGLNRYELIPMMAGMVR